MGRKKTKQSWNYCKRIALSEFIKEKGYSCMEIGELLGLSHSSVYNEVRRGLSEEDYAKGRYVKYDPLEATYAEVYPILGDKGMEAVYKKWQENNARKHQGRE